MAVDGFLGYINEEDPVSSDVRQCIDAFLVLPKEEQNLYFSMYDNKLDYSEKKDEFGKIITYNLSDWIKTAIEHIKGFDKDDCVNYALSKSVANINSIKITKDDDKVQKSITYTEKHPIFTDEFYNRTVYSDGSIIDNNTGEELSSINFNFIIAKKNKEVDGKELHPNADIDKENYNRINKTANPDLRTKNDKTAELTEITKDNDRENNLIEIKKVENVDETVYKAQGRTNYLNWDEFFMNVALLCAKRSKDPITQVGAVLVRNNRIISTGYNGMPYAKKVDNDKAYPWNKSVSGEIKLDKRAYVVHAELNAILNARQSVEGCTIYTTLFPCNECAKAIVQSGIKKVIYISKDDKDIYEISEELLINAGIEIKKLTITPSV